MKTKSRRPSTQRRPTAQANGNLGTQSPQSTQVRGLVRCAIREGTPREFAPGLAGERVRLIVVSQDKWVNGTLPRFGFFDNSGS